MEKTPGSIVQQSDPTSYSPLLDGSPQMRAIGTVIENIADTDATVLVCGESGVGKDLVARAIHAASSRRHGPFVKVNCAAIPTGLLESELFGHEKGAFTGAHRRKPGQFEYANQGTIYLDEIAELPLALQAKLLHVLQDFRFSRVGGQALLAVDIRVIAATNRNLEEAMASGQFRADLYYRLNVVEIRVPRCGSAAKRFRNWPRGSWPGSTRSTVGTRSSCARRWRGSRSTRGRATSGSSKT